MRRTLKPIVIPVLRVDPDPNALAALDALLPPSTGEPGEIRWMLDGLQTRDTGLGPYEPTGRQRTRALWRKRGRR